MKSRIPKPTSGHLDRWFFFSLVSRGRVRISTLRCPEVGLELCEILVLAAAAVSVVIWRYAIGRSLSIWNARMMQLHFFSGRTLGELARGARRRLFRLQISNCNFDFEI